MDQLRVNGKAVRALRRKLGLSDRAAAKRIGISHQALVLIEHEVSARPRLLTLQAIARAFRVSLDEITR